MQDEQSINRNLDGNGAFSDQRVSACDNKKIPSDCYDFQAHYGRTCTVYSTVEYQSEGCHKLFHIDCLVSLQHTSVDSMRSLGDARMHCSFTALFDEDDAGKNLEDEEEHQEEANFQKKMSYIGVD